MGTATLIQNTAGSVVVFAETLGGTPAPSLTTADVSLDIKKPNAAAFVNVPLVAGVNATADIGTGADGTVTLEAPGTAGNAFTVEVFVPAGTSPLEVTVVSNVIEVNLAVDSGVAVAADNTATLVAQTISDAWAGGFAEASGTGEDPLTIAEAVQTLAGGTDGTFINIGNGFYTVVLSAGNLDTTGSMYIQLRGPTIRPALESVLVIDSLPVTPPTVTVPGTTLITGVVSTLAGNLASGISVIAKTLSVPSISGGVAATVDAIYTKTDSNGQFVLKLLTGSQVDILIPAVNFRRTITVPASSANLFSMP